MFRPEVSERGKRMVRRMLGVMISDIELIREHYIEYQPAIKDLSHIESALRKLERYANEG